MTPSYDNQPAIDMLLKYDRSIVNWRVQDLGALVDSFGGDSRSMLRRGYRMGKHDMLAFLFNILNELKGREDGTIL